MYEPEEYDKAVDSALERGENVEQYLATRTGAESRVYVPKQVMDLSPEQSECSHAIFERIGIHSLFRCTDCGAEFPMPEFEENFDLDVASEPIGEAR